MYDAIKDSLTNKNYLATSYKFFTDPTYVASEESRERLIKHLMTEGEVIDTDSFVYKTIDGIRTKVKNPNSGQPKIRKGMSRAKAEDLLRDFDVRRDLKAEDIKQGMSSLNPFKHKNPNMSKEWQDYLGLIEDTGERMQTSVNKLARSTIYAETDNRIKNILIEQGFGNVSGKTPEGWVPLQGRHGVLKVKNASGGENAVYVPKAIQEALKEVYTVKVDEHAHNGIIASLQDLWESGISFSKATKVIGNIPSYIVNLWSSVGYQAAMGINPTYRLGKAMKLTAATLKPTRELAFKLLSKDGANPYDELSMLMEKGILNNSIVSEDIRAGLKKGKIGEVMDKWISPLGDVYSSPDNITRINIFYHTRDKMLRKIFPNVKDVDALNDEAARLTNDIYQNYSKLPPLVQRLSRMGILGQFSAFPIELARNTYNQTQLAINMMRGKYGQEIASRLGGTIDEDAMAKEGFRLLMFQMTAMSAARCRDLGI
jgi:hypothetical protein